MSEKKYQPKNPKLATKEPIMTLAEALKDGGKPWYNLRDKSLTNKDAAALMNDAPWCTPEELLARKLKFVSTRVEANTPEKRKTERGTSLQGKELSEYKELNGQKVKEGAIYQNDVLPYMIARVPYFNEKNEPVIAMSTGRENKDYWENGRVPKNVKDEALWMAAVLGAHKVHVVCAIDNMDANWKNMDQEWKEIPGVKKEYEMREISAIEPANKKRVHEMFEAAEKFYKEMTRPYLVVNVPESCVKKNEQSYDVTIETGTVVTIPQDKVKENKGIHQFDSGVSYKEDKYSLVLPIKNAKGQSYTFKSNNGKALSSAEIYCKRYAVRGKMLFANNRNNVKKKTSLKEKTQTTQNSNEHSM